MSNLRQVLRTAFFGKKAVRKQMKTMRIHKKIQGRAQGYRGMIVMRDKLCYRHCLKQLQALGVNPEKRVEGVNAVVCRFPAEADLSALRAHAMVKRVERDRRMKLHGAVTEACASINKKQVIPWGVNRVGAPGVWSKYTGRTVRVAVLDTGISGTHPDLRVSGRYNAVEGQPGNDQNGHGTHTAGTIAALNNKFGVIGVAPKVELYSVKAFDANGSAYISDIAEGLHWCIRNGMQVINMSFGMTEASPTIRDLIRTAYRKHIVLVASCGNSGSMFGEIEFPARLPEVIAVAATTRSNKIASFSSRGGGIAAAAPGEDICSTLPGKTYGRMSGTSMAAPHVSGAAALLLAKNRKLTPGRIRRLLQTTARSLPGYTVKDQGAGLIRVAAALNLA